MSSSAFAVVRLMTRSNLVGCSTRMSPGFAPRSILSTYSAARRNRSGTFGPYDMASINSRKLYTLYRAVESRLFLMLALQLLFINIDEGTNLVCHVQQPEPLFLI